MQLIDEDWEARLPSWFEDRSCDVWVLNSHSEEATEYAWNRFVTWVSTPPKPRVGFAYGANIIKRKSIEAIGFGLINLRRSSRRRYWFACDSWPEMIGPCGEAIERGFVARDFLADDSDDALLQVRLRHAPNLRWQRGHQLWDLATGLQCRKYFTSGLPYTGSVDSEVVRFVNRGKGQRQLGEDLREIAAERGEAADSFAPRFLTTVRHLIERGYLMPGARP